MKNNEFEPNTYHEDRPWGYFDKFIENKKCTVKILTVNPGEKLSLQYHINRDEFVRVIDGDGVIVMGDKEIPCEVGSEFFIPANTKHRIIGGSEILRTLEISLGDFDEEDNIRIEDEYGRTG